jgi:hypothetical protein
LRCNYVQSFESEGGCGAVGKIPLLLKQQRD